MILSVLKVIPLLQAFSSAIFRICGASRGPSAFAELLVCLGTCAAKCGDAAITRIRVLL